MDASAITSHVSQLSIAEESLEPNQVPRLPPRVPVKNRISPAIGAKALKSAISVEPAFETLHYLRYKNKFGREYGRYWKETIN